MLIDKIYEAAEVVAVIMMVAPSPTDDHLMNHSEAAVRFETERQCRNATNLFNQVPVRTPDGQLVQPYYWCNTITRNENGETVDEQGRPFP